MTSLKSSLTRIRHHRLDDRLISLAQRGGATRVADELVGALDHAVALASLGGDDLAAGRHLEPLLAARLGLHLGHFRLLFRSVVPLDSACLFGPDQRIERAVYASIGHCARAARAAITADTGPSRRGS